MKRINQFDFYQLGIAVRALEHCKGETTVGDVFHPLFGARMWLEKLLSGEIFELRHCRHEAERLLEEVDHLMQSYHYRADHDLDFDRWGEKIPDYKFYGIHSVRETFEHNLAAEFREAATYYVSQVGMYNTSDLVDRAEIQIPDDLRAFIKSDAQNELKSAGRCLAFNLPTAAGFHVLRAAELVLQEYYYAVSGNYGKKLHNWNEYARELEKLFDKDIVKRPSKKVIRGIRQIKDLDRNPIMHPEDVLEFSDAMILFNVAISAISEMAKELKKFAGQGHLKLGLPLEGGENC